MSQDLFIFKESVGVDTGMAQEHQIKDNSEFPTSLPEQSKYGAHLTLLTLHK